MNRYQKELMSDIEHLKEQLREAHGDDRHRISRQMRHLARCMSRDDDREPFLRQRDRRREGRGGSRSPSFGKWGRDDE